MLEALIFAGISTLLYHLGMGFLLFLIPLEVVLVRKGRRAFLASLAMAAALIVAIKLISIGGALDANTVPFVVLEVFVVVIMTAGLVLVQLPELFAEARHVSMRRVTRLVLATAAAGLVALPLIVYLRGNEAFNTAMAEVFDSLAEGLQRTMPGGENAIAAAELLGGIALSGQALMQFVGEVFWRGFLFSYFLLLGLSWWLGTRIGVRFQGRSPVRPPAGARSESPAPATNDQGPIPLDDGLPVAPWPRVLEFRLPDTYIWPLIASLALILLGLVVPLGPLELIAWNAGIIFLFLYGVSGIGVVQYFLRRFRVPRGMRLLLGLILCVLVISPRANLAVFILIPGLGVSEIWLKYRTKERSNG